MLTELVDVKSFDWSTLPSCGFFEVLGKRGTGKTTWTQFILQSSPNRDTGVFVVVAGSETAKHSWSKIVHPVFVVDPSLKHLEMLKTTQNELVRHYQKIGEPFPPERQVTLVFDDVSSNKELMRSHILAYLASNSRHLQMSIFILAQYHCQIVSEVRNQFDIVFTLSTADKRSIDRIYSEYCSCLDARVFRHILGTVTQNFGLLVINNQSNSNKIDDICFYSHMKPYPPELQALGGQQTWDFGRDHYCDQDNARPDVTDAEEWQETRDRDEKTNHVINDRKGCIVIRMS
tara:strand:- start:618 stop:1484 length:867 start_codon:yes stop_codon:yes gene_type:complete